MKRMSVWAIAALMALGAFSPRCMPKPCYAYSGTISIWAQKDNDYIAKNFAGTTAGLQAAVSYLGGRKGVIQLGPGLLNLSAVVALNDSAQLRGSGAGLTTLWQQTSTTDGITLGDYSVVSDLTLRGRNVAEVSRGINGGGTIGSRISGCIIEQWGSLGINLANDSSDNLIVGCVIRNNLNGGVFVGQSSNANRISSNEISGNLNNNGVDINGSRNVVSGNTVYSNGIGAASPDGAGIFLWSAATSKPCNSNLVANNIVFLSARENVRIQGGVDSCVGNVIVGNSCSAPGQGGGDSNVAVTNAGAGLTQHNSVVSNYMSGGVNNGFVVDGASTPSGTLVSMNIIVGSSGNGIYVGTASDTQILSNVLLGNATAFSAGGTRTTLAGNKTTTSDGTYRIQSASDITVGAATALSLNATAGSPSVDIGTFVEAIEQASDPSAPSSNKGRIYLKDNGAGKTQLVVRFASGAVQVIATEP